MCVETYKWATFRETKAGVELYFRLDFVTPEDVYPETLQLTTACSHDRTQLDELVSLTLRMYLTGDFWIMRNLMSITNNVFFCR
ncbi:hypothetical protein [Brevibacillus fortis]|uniref:hypothetical protein n=1 Tax=Brevibacillus fortis TaxID=2126352 RepID=UPI0038FD23D9